MQSRQRAGRARRRLTTTSELMGYFCIDIFYAVFPLATCHAARTQPNIKMTSLELKSIYRSNHHARNRMDTAFNRILKSSIKLKVRHAPPPVLAAKGGASPSLVPCRGWPGVRGVPTNSSGDSARGGGGTWGGPSATPPLTFYLRPPCGGPPPSVQHGDAAAALLRSKTATVKVPGDVDTRHYVMVHEQILWSGRVRVWTTPAIKKVFAILFDVFVVFVESLEDNVCVFDESKTLCEIYNGDSRHGPSTTTVSASSATSLLFRAGTTDNT
ncbi:hypothetical protein Syun_006198 [Stephania yunnanensis]|uniref:Uncharacterized protein n=1 Tax=Stephania yunnanensis TaxID=152371 RepID=A0AAP0KXU2_9MAGN